MELVVLLNWTTAALSLLAAAFWLTAGIVRVPYVDEGTSVHIVSTDENTGKETDVLGTARRQTYWNRWAAVAAALAASSQAISLMS